MTVAADTGAGNADGALRLRWDLVERRCREIDPGADSDTKLADLLGVSRMTVQRWKHGWTGVSTRQAVRVSKVIGVRLDQLLAEEGHPSPPPPQPPRPSGPPGREADR